MKKLQKLSSYEKRGLKDGEKIVETAKIMFSNYVATIYLSKVLETIQREVIKMAPYHKTLFDEIRALIEYSRKHDQAKRRRLKKKKGETMKKTLKLKKKWHKGMVIIDPSFANKVLDTKITEFFKGSSVPKRITEKEKIMLLGMTLSFPKKTPAEILFFYMRKDLAALQGKKLTRLKNALKEIRPLLKDKKK